MPHVASPSLTRQLGKLFEGGSTAGLTDRQLIEEFATGGDDRAEAAFAALVARHGPMVLGVCRQLLRDRQHAEDAFQAVFLVLARKARSLREPELLGNWLYGVALRTVRKARGRVARLRQTEEAAAVGRPEALSAAQAAQMIDGEQAEALHGEINRLPGNFRLPVVLCYFEGLTLDEAAHRLKWPVGTLRSRLARAREKLRRGLLRRGFVLSSAAVAAALASRSALASVSPLLCDSTTRAATHFAARHAAGGALAGSAAAMAREILQTMILHKLKTAALSLLLLGTLATAVGYFACALATAPDQPGEAPALKPQVVAKSDDSQRPAPGRMFVVGRVLDPQGKPVANATTMVYAALKWAGRGVRLAPMWPAAIGQAQSDGSGRFRVDAPRVSSSRQEVFGLIATAPDYGAGWVKLDPDAAEPAADITLRPEQVIEGRLFDLQGRPVRGVTISVESMGTIASGSSDATLEETDGPYFLPDQPEKLPGWPRPATTDLDGHFTIHGAGRGIGLGVQIDDPRFAKLLVEIHTDSSSEIKNVTMAVEPARVVNGRVTYADTGEPAVHARVEMETQRQGSSGWAGDFETDAMGRFRANPGAADHYRVTVFAPDDAPYLTLTKEIEWPKGALEQTVEHAAGPGRRSPRQGDRGSLWNTDRGPHG